MKASCAKIEHEGEFTSEVKIKTEIRQECILLSMQFLPVMIMRKTKKKET